MTDQPGRVRCPNCGCKVPSKDQHYYDADRMGEGWTCRSRQSVINEVATLRRRAVASVKKADDLERRYGLIAPARNDR